MILFCLLTGNCSGDFTFNITMFFEPYVRQWLLNTDSKTKMWVEAVGTSYSYVVMQLKIEVLFVSRPLLKIK